MPEREVSWNRDGLVPAIVQHDRTREVLMMAWMDRRALELTLASGVVHFWSRSRRVLWKKGETSGNTLTLVDLAADCDGDTLVVRAMPAGPHVIRMPEPASPTPWTATPRRVSPTSKHCGRPSPGGWKPTDPARTPRAWPPAGHPRRDARRSRRPPNSHPPLSSIRKAEPTTAGSPRKPPMSYTT